ncbi:hypothetical protein Hanom_Chr04g00312541 [Helianthus anomalus]
MSWRAKKSALPGALPEGFVYDKYLYASLMQEDGWIQKLSKHILVMGKISTSLSYLCRCLARRSSWKMI